MDTAAARLRAQSKKKLSKKNLNTREGRYKFAAPTHPGTAIFVATKYIPIRTANQRWFTHPVFLCLELSGVETQNRRPARTQQNKDAFPYFFHIHQEFLCKSSRQKISYSRMPPPQPYGDERWNEKDHREDRQLVHERVASASDSEPHIHRCDNQPHRNEQPNGEPRCTCSAQPAAE